MHAHRCIPVKVSKVNGKVEVNVLMITSRGGKGLVFPKVRYHLDIYVNPVATAASCGAHCAPQRMHRKSIYERIVLSIAPDVRCHVASFSKGTFCALPQPHMPLLFSRDRMTLLMWGQNCCAPQLQCPVFGVCLSSSFVAMSSTCWKVTRANCTGRLGG